MDDKWIQKPAIAFVASGLIGAVIGASFLQVVGIFLGAWFLVAVLTKDRE